MANNSHHTKRGLFHGHICVPFVVQCQHARTPSTDDNGTGHWDNFGRYHTRLHEEIRRYFKNIAARERKALSDIFCRLQCSDTGFSDNLVTVTVFGSNKSSYTENQRIE